MKRRRVCLGDFHLGQQRLEHPRHDVLAAKRKRRRNAVRFAGLDHVKGRPHKPPGHLRHLAPGQAPGQAVRGDAVDKIVDPAEVGPDLAHRLAVHVEVTDVLRLAAGQCPVRLLLGDDLIDESTDVAGAVWQPRRTVRCEGLLQALEQRHEIPHRIHVMLHEHPQARQRGDGVENRMPDELRPERLQ